jgi:hypothetical protein
VTSRISFSFTQNFARVLTLTLPPGSYLFSGYAQFTQAGAPQDNLVTCELQGTGYVISSFTMVIKDGFSPQNLPIGGAATLLAPDTVGLDCEGTIFTFLGGPVGAFLSATTTNLVVTTG